MANILLTYDISSKHTEVKKAMKIKGYTDYIKTSANITYLPNTSLNLKKENITAAQVRDEFIKVVAAINASPQTKPKIVVERVIAVEYDDWGALSGYPHQE